MNFREGSVICFHTPVYILSGAGAVGSYEREGPLAGYFDVEYPDDGMNSQSWEDAETVLLQDAVMFAVNKAKIQKEDVDCIFGGDLLNQCTATSFGIEKFGIPLAGLYGACSTFALGLALAGLTVSGDAGEYVMASASSHYCSAEKQYRMPLEYGGQRTPTAQRTVTGAGAVVVGKNAGQIQIAKIKIGTVVDAGITDVTNMGAAMAPAAARTLADFFHDTNTRPKDYDLVLTGDLGQVGTKLLLQLMKEEEHYDITPLHSDCGNLIFNAGVQDVHSGGSGAGCSAAVVSTWLLKKMRQGEYKRVLFAGTGALMSPLTSLQGKSIPAIAHAVELRRNETI